MQALPPVLHHAVRRARGQEVDRHVGISLAQGPGDGEIALDVAEADRAREPQHAPRALAPSRARRGLDGHRALGPARDADGLDGPLLHEVADEPVDLDRLAAEEAVAAVLEGHQARPRDRGDHLLRVPVRHDAVPRAVDGQGGHPHLGQEVVEVDAVEGPERLHQDLGGGLAGPRHPVLHALEGVRLREHPGEEAPAPAVEVIANHRGHPLLEGPRHRLRVLAAEQDQVREPLRVVDRVPERERPRAGERHQREGRSRCVLDHRGEVGVAAVEVVAGGGTVRAAVAALVHRDHAEVPGEVRHLVLPHAAVGHHLAGRQQEEVALAAAGRLVEDLGVGPIDVHARSAQALRRRVSS